MSVWTLLQAGGLGLLVTAAVLSLWTGHAGATPTVTLSPSSSSYANQQVITVTGSGFSPRASGLTIEIVECADPGGATANLPTDNSTCDATTENPNTIYPDASGNFSSSYTLSSLATSSGNLITCDASDDCVLWVGEDFVNNFSGTSQEPAAFSSPFSLTSASGGSSGSGSSGSGGSSGGGGSGNGTTTGGGPPGTTGTSSTTATTVGGITTASGTQTTTATPSTTSAPSSATAGGSTPGPASSSASATSPATDAQTSGASLAFTGPPTMLPWLVGGGALMVGIGALGRRRLAREDS